MQNQNANKNSSAKPQKQVSQIENTVNDIESFLRVIKNQDTLYAIDQTELKSGLVSKADILRKCQVESQMLFKSQQFLPSTGHFKVKLNADTKCLDFPTYDRWLNGLEYSFMIRHYRAYLEMHKNSVSMTSVGHPENVYEQPSNGQFYFIRGWHLREFGFPRANDLKKVFKWKKMNFTTDLPKQDPICSYLVATGKVGEECYRMHVVVNSQEYSKEYRKSEVLKELKIGQNEYERINPNRPQEKEKQKLLPQDRVSKSERIILCHVIRITTGETRKQGTQIQRNPRIVKNKLIPKKRKSRRSRGDLVLESDSLESSVKLTEESQGSVIDDVQNEDKTDLNSENFRNLNNTHDFKFEDKENLGIGNPSPFNKGLRRLTRAQKSQMNNKVYSQERGQSFPVGRPRKDSFRHQLRMNSKNDSQSNQRKGPGRPKKSDQEGNDITFDFNKSIFGNKNLQLNNSCFSKENPENEIEMSKAMDKDVMMEPSSVHPLPIAKFNEYRQSLNVPHKQIHKSNEQQDQKMSDSSPQKIFDNPSKNSASKISDQSMKTVTEQTDDILLDAKTFSNQDQISSDGVLETVTEQVQQQSIDQRLIELMKSEKTQNSPIKAPLQQTPILKTEPETQTKTDYDYSYLQEQDQIITNQQNQQNLQDLEKVLQIQTQLTLAQFNLFQKFHQPQMAPTSNGASQIDFRDEHEIKMRSPHLTCLSPIKKEVQRPWKLCDPRNICEPSLMSPESSMIPKSTEFLLEQTSTQYYHHQMERLNGNNQFSESYDHESLFFKESSMQKSPKRKSKRSHNQNQCHRSKSHNKHKKKSYHLSVNPRQINFDGDYGCNLQQNSQFFR